MSSLDIGIVGGFIFEYVILGLFVGGYFFFIIEGWIFVGMCILGCYCGLVVDKV